MTNQDLDIDRMIREALSEEDAQVWDALVGESSIHDDVVGVFQGRHRWLTYLAVLGTLAFMALAVYCAVRYFGADGMEQKLDWGGAILGCLLAILSGKLWYWMEMQRHALTREIKRLELQVASLAHGLRGGSSD